MSNIQIESDLKDILNKLDSKLDHIDHKFELKIKTVNENLLATINPEQVDVEIQLMEESAPGIEDSELDEMS